MLIFNFLLYLAVIVFVDARNLGVKIINGTDADIKDIPWQVVLLRNETEHCGGAIIGPREILTAAHCYTLDPKPLEIMHYRAGSSNKLEGGELHEIESVIIHPEYELVPEHLIHDIAFVRVKEPFNYSDSIQPIEIGDKEPEDGEEALISGWGIYKINIENGTLEYPLILQSVTLPVVEREKCKEWYAGFYYEVLEDQLCVGTYEGLVGGCSGDSGGPMVVNNKIVGVASWADLCARPHHPTVYSSVPYHKDWIEQQLATN